MGNIKVDLSKFQHVKSDGKSTTLRHEDGHLITLAHPVLSKPHQEALKMLAKPEMPEAMAQGGQYGSVKVIDTEAKPVDPSGGRNLGVRYPTLNQGSAGSGGGRGSSSNSSGSSSGGGGNAVRGAGGREVDALAEGGRVPRFCAYCGSPSHQGECSGGEIKKYAEGTPPGGASNEDTQETKPQAPVTINIGQPAQGAPVQGLNAQGIPNALASAPTADSQSPAPAPAPAQAPPQAQQGDGSGGDAEQRSVQGVGPTDTTQPPSSKAVMDMADNTPPELKKQQEVKQELDTNAMNVHNDLQNGHIDPQSVQSLFANASTPGKIGAIFGLLLGGIGGGLTKSPNAAMEMIDKIITTDVNKQRQKFDSQNTFYRLHEMDQPMNQANIAKAQAEGKLTDQQAAVARQEASLKAFQNAWNTTLINSFHGLTKDIDSMPEGPQKEQKKAAQAALFQEMGSKISNMNDAVAAKVGQLQMMGLAPEGNGSQQQPNDEQRTQRQNLMLKSGVLGQQGKEIGQMRSEGQIPGVPEVSGQTVARAIPQEKRDQLTAMQVLDNKAKDVLNFARQNKTNLEKMNPLERRKILEQGAQKSEELTAFYSKAVDSGVMTKGRMEWLDKQIGKNPASVFQDISGDNAKLEEIIKSNNGRKMLQLKALGFTPKPTDQPREGQTGTHNGKPVIFSNGAWQYR